MTTTLIPAGLDQVQAEIARLETQRAELGSERAKISARLQTIEAQAGRLTQELVLGDSTASARLDKLDTEKKDLERKLQGIQPEIRRLDSELSGWQQSRQQLHQVRNQEEQDNKVSAYARTIAEDALEMLESWQRACLARYRMERAMAEGSGDLALDEAHRASVLRMINPIQEAILGASLSVVNDRWVRFYGAWSRELTVIAACPPETALQMSAALAKLRKLS
jgi:chromosome segregation ATPase